MRGSVKHLFERFQNSLGDERTDWREHPRERWASRDTRLQEIVRGARERGEFLPKEIESLRKLLCELLDEENCAEWLGYKKPHGWESLGAREIPCGGPNLKQFEDKKLRQRWLVAVGYQIKKAKALYGQDDHD